MKRLPQIALLPDGKRLHLQDGPIDSIVEAKGAAADIRAAYEAAARRFTGLLDELCEELTELRSAADPLQCSLKGVVARRMHTAVAPFAADCFITPMAAVAGSVADHVLETLTAGRTLSRAYVNDGGDIAFHLSPGQRLTCGVVADLAAPGIDGTVELTADMPVRGVATSGCATKGSGGRSFSLGIADAVTVLAHDAAAADAAATIIANAVDLPGHPAVARAPAISIDPDSDLGDRQVTLKVGLLADDEARQALAAGVARAEAARQSGLIYGAVLVLQRRFVTVGAGLKLPVAA